MDKFDKESFLNILNRIKSKYESQNKMANAMNLSSAYFTKLFDINTKNPPAPEYLKRIADNSKGITTYQELMQICGYIDNNKLDDIKKDLTNEKNEINEQIFKIKSKFNDKEKNFINNILAKNTFNKEQLQLYDEIDKVRSSKVKKYLELYDNLEIINNKLKLCDQKNININSLKKSNKIPILGHIPAGIPIEMIEDVIGYEEISENMLKGDKKYFALKVEGNSMYPIYLNGDILIILKQPDCESGDDAIIAVNGNDATFKRVYKSEKGITLQPLNINEFSPVFYSNKEIEEKPVKILGIVVEFRRKIKHTNN